MANSILDLSPMIWAKDPEGRRIERSVVLMQDFDHADVDSENFMASWIYFRATFGKFPIEDGYSGGVPAYLGIRGQDGDYFLERAEPYMEMRDMGDMKEYMVLDIQKLPPQIGGISLGRVETFHFPIPTHWQSGAFLPKDASRKTWQLEIYEIPPQAKRKSL